MMSARQELIAMIDNILAEWKAGQDWRVGNGQHRQAFDPEDIIVDSVDPDTRSLRAAREYTAYFLHEMNHRDPNLDGLAWEDAVVVLEETGTRLRDDLPIEDVRVLKYMRESRTPEQVIRANKVTRGRL